MISVTMILALRTSCLMIQEHETEVRVRDFFVRRKVNSHDIILMSTSFWFGLCVVFFNLKKKFSQWD